MKLSLAFLMVATSVFAERGDRVDGEENGSGRRDSDSSRSSKSDISTHSLGISNKEICGPEATNGMEWNGRSCVCKTEMKVRMKEVVDGKSVTTACLEECPRGYHQVKSSFFGVKVPKCKKCEPGSHFSARGCQVCDVGTYHAPRLTDKGEYEYAPMENQGDCTTCTSTDSVYKRSYGTLMPSLWATRSEYVYDDRDWKQITKGRSCFCDNKEYRFNPFTNRCQPILCQGVNRFEEITGECVPAGKAADDVVKQQAFLAKFRQI